MRTAYFPLTGTAMNKLVSILMPTRNPHDGLLKALRSIKSTASDFSQIEILLRIDLDDEDRIKLFPNLLQEFGAIAVMGKRGHGYMDMGVFVDDLVAFANGRWCWLFDDDAWVEGKTWQQQLEESVFDPVSGPAFSAEHYQLGNSHYDGCGPVGLIVPIELCKSLKHRNPVDDQWLSVIRSKGWTINLLKGITYCHDGRPR